jgi:iron(III) transport system ATP-binding protein
VAGAGRFVPPHRRGVGYVPQDSLLFPHLTVAQNVAFGLPRRGRRDARVAELLELVGLGDLGARRPHELSGGQQQRAAVARALAPEPRVVLLDEPFAALDATLRDGVRRDVKEILAASGATVVLVTHDQEEALSLADSVAVLEGGRVVQQASPSEIYGSPATLDVARFVGEANVLPGRLSARSARTAFGELPTAPHELGSGREALILVRPEQIELGEPGADAGAQPRARVLRADYYGHDVLVRLACDGSPDILARTTGYRPPDGSVVALAFRGPFPVYPAQNAR